MNLATEAELRLGDKTQQKLQMDEKSWNFTLVVVQHLLITSCVMMCRFSHGSREHGARI